MNDINLSAYLGEVAQALRTLAHQVDSMPSNNLGDTPAIPLGNGNALSEDPANLALEAYRERRRRNSLFQNPQLFGEPAWDILLDLYVAWLTGKRISVTSACIASDVPNTTALRWIKVLEEQGLIEREDDSGDARRTFVRLSAESIRLMNSYFGATAT